MWCLKGVDGMEPCPWRGFRSGARCRFLTHYLRSWRDGCCSALGAIERAAVEEHSRMAHPQRGRDTWMLAGINDVGTILVLEGWWFLSGIGRCAHDGLSWWPAVVRMAEDAKGATLKWEPVWHHRRRVGSLWRAGIAGVSP